jgi:hypothetical protein
MKKMLLAFLIIVLMTMNCFSQVTVVTTPQAKNVVLEQFTGINCGYAIRGLTISQNMLNNNPNRVVLVNIHQGGWAIPSGVQPDFRTSFGDALATGVTTYPSGTVNRRLFPGITSGTNTVLDYPKWEDAAALVLPEQSPVNIGFNTSFNTGTRVLTVNVKLYYTANSSTAINYINVALLENHVYAFQEDYDAGSHASYDHKNILRNFLTGQWGDTTHATTMGSVVNRTYNYTVPAGFNMDSCDVTVYVAESHKDIIQGVRAPAKSGSNDGSTSIYIGSLIDTSDIIQAGTPADTNHFLLSASSAFAGAEFMMFTLTNNAPGDWNANYIINGTPYTNAATISMTQGTPLSIKVNVIPGTTKALATYTLTMTSVTYPTAPAKTFKVYVNQGITDLIVKGSGKWGDGGTYDFDTVYTNGLNYAHNTSFASTTADIMKKGFAAAALNSVGHIYYNVAWTLPTLTDDEALALKQFMTNGGNLFIAGQDIAADISGSGTAITQDFLANYLHASLNVTGTATNNQLNAVTTDTIFGSVPVSSILDVYNGHQTPDQVNTTGIGTSIFYYNGNPSKKAGVSSYNGTYKTVYMAVGPEMLGDTAVKKLVIKLAHNWFHGIFTDVEYVEAMNNLSLGQNYPNPGIASTKIPVNNIQKDVTLQILDQTGRVIIEQPVKKGTSIIDVNTFFA